MLARSWFPVGRLQPTNGIGDDDDAWKSWPITVNRVSVQPDNCRNCRNCRLSKWPYLSPSAVLPARLFRFPSTASWQTFDRKDRNGNPLFVFLLKFDSVEAEFYSILFLLIWQTFHFLSNICILYLYISYYCFIYCMHLFIFELKRSFVCHD